MIINLKRKSKVINFITTKVIFIFLLLFLSLLTISISLTKMDIFKRI